MTRDDFIKAMLDAGDATVNYTSLNSNKPKYTVCTLDLSTDYIVKKGQAVPKDDGTVLVFAWDADSFKHINPSQVRSVVPLSHVLNNE